MYQELIEHEGELAAWHAATVVAHMPFVNARLSPRAINPYRRVTATRRADEVRAFIASMAWQVMVKEAMELEEEQHGRRERHPGG